MFYGNVERWCFYVIIVNGILMHVDDMFSKGKKPNKNTDADKQN